MKLNKYRRLKPIIKPLLLIFIGLLCYHDLSSQNWLPIGTKWSFKSSIFGQPVENNQYIITGKTFKNGKLCSILEKSQVSCDLKPLIEYFYKEDGKLFYYSETDLEFKLLYDFEADVGEIITIPIWEGFGSLDNRYIRIDSISTESINNFNFKKYYVSDGYLNSNDSLIFYTSWIPNNIIIEDVGRLGTFSHYLESGFCDASYTFPLDSFFHPTFGYIDFNQTPLNSSEIQESNLSIYPNPVSTELYIIDLKKEVGKVIIFNLLGKKQHVYFKEKNLGEQIEINFTKWRKGIYLVLIFDKKNSLLRSEKIIKL